MWYWLKDNAASIGAICVVLGLFGGFAKVVVVDPIHQRFDAVDQRFDDFEKYINERFNAVDQRFDAVDKRLDGLTSEVTELRKLTTSISERVSRNEGVIDVLRQQLQTADKPTP